MTYVDAFVMPVQKNRVDDYRSTIAETWALWQEFGALTYSECVADDVPYGEVTSFPRAVQAREDETIILSWVTYPSRAVRDDANKKMMSDPRMVELMEKAPVDGRRMIFGGFEAVFEG